MVPILDVYLNLNFLILLLAISKDSDDHVLSRMAFGVSFEFVHFLDFFLRQTYSKPLHFLEKMRAANRLLYD